MSDGQRGQLRFEFHELAQEIDALKAISGDFVAPEGVGALRQLSDDLESIWCAAEDSVHHWKLHDLWTTVSKGEYEPPGRTGPRTVVACIDGIWDVRPLGAAAKKPAGRRKRIVEFCGVASTRVRIFDHADRDNQLAMWRMELGAVDSPGCFFHVQVLGESETTQFPKSISVPRLPSLFVSPMGAVEFVFGEFFQDRWARTATEDVGSVHRWANFQRERLVRLLDWQRKTVQGAMTSPWIALKRQKPDAKMFLAR